MITQQVQWVVKNLFFGEDKIFKSDSNPITNKQKNVVKSNKNSLLKINITGNVKKIPPVSGTDIFVNL